MKKEEEKLTPSQLLERNGCGLLTHLKYEFDNLGFVNYKKLIPQEYLVPNRQYFEKRGEPIPKTSEGLEDNQMLVLLAGWRWLARVRGYDSIIHEMINSTEDSVTVKTTICWRPNYETENKSVCFSALATASFANTSDFAQMYLAEIAENRGFSRAVRGFLNINLLGADELAPTDKLGAIQSKDDFKPIEPHGLLEKKLQDKGKTFEQFKKEWVKAGHPDAKDWNAVGDIPIPDLWNIIDAIKKKESK
jgi:hypothetical protein